MPELKASSMPILARTDIIIIGAGPAGSSTAAAAAAHGASVMMLERKRQIGLPVQCAEYVPLNMDDEIPVPAESIAQRVEGFITLIEGEQAAQTRAPGYILHRDIFEHYLGRRAAEAGAKVWTGVRAEAITQDGVLVCEQGKYGMIKGKIIVGADGPFSLVAKTMQCPSQGLAYARQYTVQLRKPLNWAYIFFDRSCPGGYGWLFPKKNLANLGVSVDLNLGGRLINALELLQGKLIHEGVIESEVIRTTGGAIPAAGPRKRTQIGNYILVGDAAGHTHPVSGEGIFPAIVAGKIAGKLAADSVNTNDFQLIEQYPLQWSARLGKFLDRGVDKKKYYNQRWGEEDFTTLVHKTWFAFSEYFK